MLLLIRLRDQKTDIVITYNLPDLEAEADEVGPGCVRGSRYEKALEGMERVAAKFEVKNWGLFKGDGED